MCLLAVQPEGVVIADEWLRDFYSRNSDGFGYMHAENNRLYYNKITGSVDDMVATYKQVAGKQAVLHWRMATHGHVDPINSHPYPVLTEDDGYPLFLAHNGVLSCGNGGDATKSDTRFYIDNFLRPILLHSPELFKEPAFKKMVESHIGAGNKFVLMDAYGHIEIYNQSAGTEWEASEGKPKMWVSNTYSWAAAKAGLIKSYSGSRALGEWDNEATTYYPGRRKTTRTPQAVIPFTPTEQWVRDFAADTMNALNTYGLRRSWIRLLYKDLYDFAECVGKDICASLLVEIKSGGVNDDTLEPWMDNAIDLTVALSSEKLEQAAAPKFLSRMVAHEFFTQLRHALYDEAWDNLSVANVNNWLDSCTDAEYVELINGVRDGTTTNAAIVDAVLAYAKDSFQ